MKLVPDSSQKSSFNPWYQTFHMAGSRITDRILLSASNLLMLAWKSLPQSALGHRTVCSGVSIHVLGDQCSHLHSPTDSHPSDPSLITKSASLEVLLDYGEAGGTAVEVAPLRGMSGASLQLARPPLKLHAPHRSYFYVSSSCRFLPQRL